MAWRMSWAVSCRTDACAKPAANKRNRPNVIAPKIPIISASTRDLVWVSAIAFASFFIVFSLVPSSPTGRCFINTRLVSWLTGRSASSPSRGLTQWLLTCAHRLQSRGRLRIKAPIWVTHSAFPFDSLCRVATLGNLVCSQCAQGVCARSRGIATPKGAFAAD
jgi:hypothetical protein